MTWEHCADNRFQRDAARSVISLIFLEQVANGGDVLLLWKVVANIFNKELLTAEKGWSCRLWRILHMSFELDRFFDKGKAVPQHTS
jgi:hypothetical protein